MRIRIAARQSDLARLQARHVGQVLQEAYPHWCKSVGRKPAGSPDSAKAGDAVVNGGLEVEYQFRASLGDLNQQDPLWKMPEKGVFTEDFLADLRDGRCDMVVHSWKDLPTVEREFSEIIATLKREDVRDVLLFRRDRRDKRAGSIQILTSSPRRIYNLENFLKQALPWRVTSVGFESVRGNIPTRMRKLIDGNADGLILAKAALDRLLGSTADEFREARESMHQVLDACDFMVLPISVNPSAAAQGALAIEVHRNVDPDIRALCDYVNEIEAYRNVQMERKILASFGGGCHQKIGVNILPLANRVGVQKRVVALQGLTDLGQKLDRFELLSLETDPVNAVARGESSTQVSNKESSGATRTLSVANIYPREAGGGESLYTRDALTEKDLQGSLARLAQSTGIWVARETAWPESYRPSQSQVIWTSGLKTWVRLAEKGIWVHGSNEGLGEFADPCLEVLGSVHQSGRSLAWTKLSHEAGTRTESMDFCATYRLRPKSKAESPDLSDRTHFFWMSGSTFDRAWELFPEALARGQHACGPGLSFEHIQKKLNTIKADSRWSECAKNLELQMHLSFESWRASVLL